MSFLSSLFRRHYESPSRRGIAFNLASPFRRPLGKGRRHSKSNDNYSKQGEIREAEKLEQRLALSVTVIGRDNLEEYSFPSDPTTQPASRGVHSGQFVIASDQGSDVFLQKVDMTPTELLIADNGSFLDYIATENVENRFSEFIVTNGSEHKYEESIVADAWWLFPTQTNDNAVSPTEDELSTANLTTTRLALDRPEVVIGPYVQNEGSTTGGQGGWFNDNNVLVAPTGDLVVVGSTTITGSDFFGSVSYLQSDGTISKWTFSAWDGLGNNGGDYVQAFGEALHITSGPGFGGRQISYKDTSISKPEGLPDGYVFPKKISVVTEQLPENLQNGLAGTKQFGGRRHYLAVDWSQVPVTPPVMEANYWGCSHYLPDGTPQNVRDPFSQREDEPPTVGVAARTKDLTVTIPRAITEGSPDGAPALGIIPGTASGTLILGGEGQEEIFELHFEDRKNLFHDEDSRNSDDIPDAANDRYTFFFDDIDNSGAISFKRQFGIVEQELETNIVTDLDSRFREQATQTHTYIEGEIVGGSVISLKIGSHVNTALESRDNLNLLYGDNSQNPAFRALDGINVVISEANLLDGTASSAVRVRDLEYHVYVKPTVPNEVYFVAGGDITRSLTVDLLSEGSSLYVNSPIRVADPEGDLDIRATNVIVNAPLETPDYFILGRSNSEASPRLPRVTDPQGGEQSTPTFLGSLLPDESTTRTVVPTPVLKGRSVETLEVLPGREGYGYDPANPPLVTIAPAVVQDGEVVVTQVAGGVSEVLLDAGGNYAGVGTGLNDGTEYMPIIFDPPDLQVVDSVHRWTQINPDEGSDVPGQAPTPIDVPAPAGYGAAPVVAISQPEIIRSSARIGYGERARVALDNDFGNGVLSVNLLSQGQNYSARPTIELVSKDPNRPFFDSRIDASLHSFPTFDFDFEIFSEAAPAPPPTGGDTGDTGVPAPEPEREYSGHRISNFRILSNGFGLNINSTQDLTDFYEFRVSGGRNVNAVDSQGREIDNSTIPGANQIQHAVVELSDAILGTLAWKGNSPTDNVGDDADGLESNGLHYETAPDVQMIGSLRAEVALEFNKDEDGPHLVDENDRNKAEGDDNDGINEDGTAVGDPVVKWYQNDIELADAFTATLTNVRAYADGTERFPQEKGRFRDVDYLSYLNDKAEGYISAFATTDNVNWVRVVPVKKDSLANFYHSIDAEAPLSSGDSVLQLDDPDVNGAQAEDDFDQWDRLREGMQISMQLTGGNTGTATHKTSVASWNRREKTLTMTDAIPAGFTLERNATVRFGIDEVMLDTDTQQFSFRKVNYYSGFDGKYSGMLFSPFNETEDANNGLLTGQALQDVDLSKTTNVRLFFDPWFENNPIDAECKLYATMKTDPAQGRASLSPRVIVTPEGDITEILEVTQVEVTYPGSGYIRTPRVRFDNDSGGAAARAIVTGGIYEVALVESGFNYQGDTRPGLNSAFIPDRPIPIYDVAAMPFGARMPKGSFIARNTQLRGGEIVDPGAGLQLVGQAGSTRMNGFANVDLKITPEPGDVITPAVFEAIVEPDGRIKRFEKLGGGNNYRIAPIASVESPILPSSAVAVSHIDSSLQEVKSIEIIDSGYRYAHAPKVFIQPPQPRGEGRIAKAVATLGPSGEVIRIDITDSGSGYTNPPRVEIQEVDSYNVVENVDIAANVSANTYEWYVSRNSWTNRERGSILVRPTNVLGENGQDSDWIYIEAAATDMTFEGDVNASKVTVLMNSREQDQPFAPYSMTTLSTATGEQSGTVIADQLVLTMGNDVPTPLSGGTLQNKVSLQTDVTSLRTTAAESVRNPRGAFPYDIHIEELNDITVEAVPRSSGSISLSVPSGDLDVVAGIFTDGDIRIETTNYSQTTPLVTEFGSISIKAESIDALNSMIVNAAEIDEQDSDITLHATNGDIDLQGTIKSPNAIMLRQESKTGQVGGNTRLVTKSLRIEAEGDVNVFSAVEEVRGSSDFGDFTLNELDDVTIPTLQVPSGTVSLTANGVDLGGGAVNPIALTARIVEGRDLFVSTPNGSMEIDVDTSEDIDLGVLNDLVQPNGQTVVPMVAAGSVQIVNSSGDIAIYDGPVAGQNAVVVKAASTESLPNLHSYQANTPGEFPSELSGPGAFPSASFAGLDEIRVGDRLLLKNQSDRVSTDRFDESRENGIFEVMRLGGGDSGYRDWLLRRTVDGDARGDLPPGSYVRVREGQHAGDIFQMNYSILPTFGVSRTWNNQLVVDSGVGGLLDIDINDVVTGDGILPGARVTGVDYEHGVVTLGMGNGYTLGNPTHNTVDGVEIGVVTIAAGDSLLFESLQGANDRNEKVLISGDWFHVGAEVIAADEQSGTITISPGGLKESSAGESVGVIGFTTAATGRVSLNPAVRSFLLNSVRKATPLSNVSIVKENVGIRIQDIDIDGQVVDGALGPFAPTTIDIRLTELDGWEVRRGDEVIWQKDGEKYVTRVTDVIRGDSTPQDAIDSGYIRVEVADEITMSFNTGDDEYPLTIRNKTHVVPLAGSVIDWDSLHVGTGVGGNGIIDGTKLIAWDQGENVLVLNQEIETEDFQVLRIDEGSGYSTDPEFKIGLTFDPPDVAAQNGGVQMEGYALPDGTGGVGEVVITQQGRGYKKAPSITIEEGVDAGVRAKFEVLFDPQYWSTEPDPQDPQSPQHGFELQHRLGGDDSSILMSANFTNYDGLAPGQPVFGDGVLPGTVITRVLPAIRRVEVTPGGLPTQLAVVSDSEGQITVSSDASTYYSEGFDNVLQMPDTFNEFHKLRVGQRVTFPQNATIPDTVITALDTTYRQIGLRAVPDGGTQPVNEVVFESIDRVEFGVITRTGSGNASFSVTPFGYEALAVTTPKLASGTARLREANDETGRYELEINEFSKVESIQIDQYVSGAGIKHGYRVASFDGRNVRLKSTTLTSSGTPNEYTVSEAFTDFSRLKEGMPVYGEAVPIGAKIAANGIDPENRTVTLDGVGDAGLQAEEVLFGNPFTDKFLSRENALTELSVHRSKAQISSLIATQNIRDDVRYAVSTEGGSDEEAGSLARHMLLAQRNEYHTRSDSFGFDIQPTVTFLPNVSSIELSEPLPSIVASDIRIDGSRTNGDTDALLPDIEVTGRFITKTSSGANVLSDSVVDGFTISGDDASGSVLRNLNFGGFSNGSAVQVVDSSGVLIDGVTIGITGNNIRSASRFGILVTGESSGTSILNTEIVSAEQAGIRVEEDATGTQISGVTLGRNYGSEQSPDIFWNETGLEVAASDVRLGIETESWKVLDYSNGAESLSGFQASFDLGERWLNLTMSQSQWRALKPGLAVIGVGLLESSFIEAVDVINQRVFISKPATRTVNNSTVLIGVQASGVFETKELEFESMPVEMLYLGQQVKIVSGQTAADVFTTTITGIDGRKVMLAEELPTDGMYEKGIRLVEFGEAVRNEIQYSRTGVNIGLSAIATGDLNGDLLTLNNDFKGWSSLKPNVTEVVISGAGDANPFVITEVLASDQAIRINKSLQASVSLAPVRFSGADNFHMTATSILNSVEDGVVFGGGENHRIGSSTDDFTVFGSKDAASQGLPAGEEVFELISFGHSNVTLVPVSVGEGSIETHLEFLVSKEAGEWIKTRLESGSSVNVFGTGLPSGEAADHPVATVVEAPLVDDVTGEYRVRITNSENAVAYSGAAVFFGTGSFIRCPRNQIVVGDAVEGEGLYEFTVIDGVKSSSDGGEGYVVLSAPDSGLVGQNSDSFPEPGKNIRFVNRTNLANVLSYNAGFGVSVVDTNPDSEIYDGVKDTWRIAGNYIDLSYDTNAMRWSRFPNALGPLSPIMFAKIFGADADIDSIQYSNFDRTDEYGNQYAEEKPVPNSDSPSSGDDNPFGQDPTDDDDTDGGGTGDGTGDGSGDGDDSGVRPGVPF